LQIVEHTAEHYEAQDVEFSKVFTWVPGNALLECDCEQVFTTEGITVAYPKGTANHRVVVRAPTVVPS
jgi:hypothetical protein